MSQVFTTPATKSAASKLTALAKQQTNPWQLLSDFFLSRTFLKNFAKFNILTMESYV